MFERVILIIELISKIPALLKPFGTACSAKFIGTMDCFRCPTKSFAMSCSFFPSLDIWAVSSKLTARSDALVTASG